MSRLQQNFSGHLGIKKRSSTEKYQVRVLNQWKQALDADSDPGSRKVIDLSLQCKVWICSWMCAIN